MRKPKMIKQAAIFQDLTDEQLARIDERGEHRTATEGDTIFAEGSSGHSLFVLLEGRVQISVKMSRDSEQAPVHTVVPGEVFGEFAFVTNQERSATARASQDSAYFAFKRETFHELADEDPKLGYVVLREVGQILVERLVKTTRELRESLMF